MADDCIFCKIINGELPSSKVYEDDVVLAILDIFPVSKGHTLIVPKKHYENVFDIPEDVMSHIGKISKKISMNLKESLNVNALNLVNSSGKDAQQDVFHFHMHVIPRTEGNGFKIKCDPKIELREEFNDILSKINEVGF